MKSRYVLQLTEADEAWDCFVDSSPHGTVYSTAACVNHLQQKPALYYCTRGDDVVAGVVLASYSHDATDVRADLLIYSGILLSRTVSTRVLDAFEVTEFIVSELARRYERIECYLSPAFVDIRAFLWHNYGTNGPKFLVSLRYTSYLDISGILDDHTGFLGTVRPLRRREIRRAERLGLVTEELFDADLCVELYRLTLARQQREATQKELSEMNTVMRAIHADGNGRMFVTRNSGGSPASAVFMGIDQKRAYYMFGGSNPKMRAEPAGTLVFWDAFRALRASGVRSVDLEGINSPKRGWFKLSFGGAITPYFGLALDQRGSLG